MSVQTCWEQHCHWSGLAYGRYCPRCGSEFLARSTPTPTAIEALEEVLRRWNREVSIYGHKGPPRDLTDQIIRDYLKELKEGAP